VHAFPLRLRSEVIGALNLFGADVGAFDQADLLSVFARIAATTNGECNLARHIEISGYQQPHAKVWTDARVATWNSTAAARWEQTGDRPAVAVWTAEQLATFLGAG
jgi:hypothetical protein